MHIYNDRPRYGFTPGPEEAPISGVVDVMIVTASCGQPLVIGELKPDSGGDYQ